MSFSSRAYWLGPVLILILFSFAACWTYQGEHLGSVKQEGMIERGEELVQGLAACGSCHGFTSVPGSILVGGREAYDRYGSATATNLTPHETGTAGMQVRDLINLFRRSEGRNGRLASAEFHSGYRWMSDLDVYAIAAYLAGLKPIKHAVEAREISWFERNFMGFWESRPALNAYVPEISRANSKAYGQYLVESVARCGTCHTGVAGWFSDEPYLRGKIIQTEKGEIKAPRLISKKGTAANRWLKEDLVHYLETGLTVSGRKIAEDTCPTKFYARAASSDLVAIASYITSLR